MRIEFTIPGEPKAQGRPQFSRGHAYTDEKSSSYRGSAQVHAMVAMRGHAVTAGPVSVTLRAFWECPDSRRRKRNPRPAEPRSARPDADNVAKMVLDALNGIVFLDDAQVARLIVEKWTAAQGEPGRVEVIVETIEAALGRVG